MLLLWVVRYSCSCSSRCRTATSVNRVSWLHYRWCLSDLCITLMRLWWYRLMMRLQRLRDTLASPTSTTLRKNWLELKLLLRGSTERRLWVMHNGSLLHLLLLDEHLLLLLLLLLMLLGGGATTGACRVLRPTAGAGNRGSSV